MVVALRRSAGHFRETVSVARSDVESGVGWTRAQDCLVRMDVGGRVRGTRVDAEEIDGVECLKNLRTIVAVTGWGLRSGALRSHRRFCDCEWIESPTAVRGLLNTVLNSASLRHRLKTGEGKDGQEPEVS